MFNWFDRSPFLAKLLERLSATMARQRGLPIVVGALLIAISFIIQLVDFAVDAPILDLLWTITHHLGLLIALIGILMVQPLGQ